MTTQPHCRLPHTRAHSEARTLGRALGRALLALAPLVAGCASTEPAPQSVDAPIVIPDDFEAARARAIAEGRPLLVNFTGHTCVNCRKMEAVTFERAPVAAARAGFVEARLHMDAADPALRKDIAKRVETVAKSLAMPTYVVLDPRTGDELARYTGADLEGNGTFQVFLEQAAARWEEAQG